MRIEKGILVFTDADFLSSFLRIGLKDFLLEVLKDNDLRIPFTVAKEIRESRIQYLKDEYNDFVSGTNVKEESEIPTDSYEFEFMTQLISLGDQRYPEYGEGELEALALAYSNEAYIASNNLQHIKIPCEDYNILYFSSVDILKKAYREKIKTKDELDVIWTNMKTVQKLPPFNSFTEYLDKGE